MHGHSYHLACVSKLPYLSALMYCICCCLFISIVLCEGSASVPRGVGWVSEENVICEPRPVETLEKPFSTDCSQSNSPTM